MKRFYRRHLPHVVPEGVPVFVTWNLKGALPRAAIDRIKREREVLARQSAKPGETRQERSVREAKLIFASTDAFLDGNSDGPLYLRDPHIAEIVEGEITSGGRSSYLLWSWCVMANHVHVLLTPQDELSAIMQRLKGKTSKEINQLQNQMGRTFWQDESYDHWVHGEEEFFRINAYIENNPVKAGLCARPENWPCSSARFRTAWAVGVPFDATLIVSG